MQFKDGQVLSRKEIAGSKGQVEAHPSAPESKVQLEEQRQQIALINQALKSVDPKLNSQDRDIISQAIRSFVPDCFNHVKFDLKIKMDSIPPIPGDHLKRWATALARGLEFVAFDPLHHATILKLDNKYGEKIYFTLGNKGEVLEIGIPANDSDSDKLFANGYKELAITSRKADELLEVGRKAINTFGAENKLSSSEVSEYTKVASKGVFKHVVNLYQAGRDLSKLSIERVDMLPNLVGIVYLDGGKRYITGYPVPSKAPIDSTDQSPEIQKDSACTTSVTPHSSFFSEILSFKEGTPSPYSDDYYGATEKYFDSLPQQDGTIKERFKIDLMRDTAVPGKAKIELTFFFPSEHQTEFKTKTIYTEKQDLEKTLQTFTSMKVEEALKAVEDKNKSEKDDDLREILAKNVHAYIEKAIQLNLITPSEGSSWIGSQIDMKVEMVVNSGLAMKVREADRKEQVDQILRNIKDSSDKHGQLLEKLFKLIEALEGVGIMDACDANQLKLKVRSLPILQREVALKGYLEEFSKRLYDLQMFGNEGSWNGEESIKTPHDLNRKWISDQLLGVPPPSSADL